MMSREPEALAEAALAITGREVTAPSATHLIRPPAGQLARLRSLYGAEFGRFSVEYRALFGEPPSVSLRRPADAASSESA